MKTMLAYGTRGLEIDLPDDGDVTVIEPEYVPDLRSVRVSLVARSQNVVRDGDGNPATYGPLQVEDRNPAPGNDGRRRSLYTRRVELSNLDPVNL